MGKIKTRGVVTKVSNGYSLSQENIDWLSARAIAVSTPKERVSASEYLNRLLTGLRAKQERAEEAFAEAHKRAGLASPRRAA